MSIEAQFDLFRDQGYLVVDDMVEPAVLDELEAAARRIRDKIRSGEVDIKTAFGDKREPSVIWGLLAPEYGEPAFAEYLASDPLLDYAKGIQGEELRLGWITLAANPPGYDTGWHRDIGEEDRDGSYEEEMAALARNLTNHCKWSLALADDPYLLVMPGSHRRYRTDQERECLVDTKFADIPGQHVVELKKGQTLFWDGNIHPPGTGTGGLYGAPDLACRAI